MRDELLAFLEDGPHAAADLAEWLEQPKRLVTRALRALRQEGLAKPVGTAKHWLLAGAVTRTGTPRGPRSGGHPPYGTRRHARLRPDRHADDQPAHRAQSEGGARVVRGARGRGSPDGDGPRPLGGLG